MNTKEALLQTIWNDPDDDVPRLVYADYLEETGKEPDIARAKFIRLGIESAKVSDPLLRSMSEVSELEAQLWRKYRKHWMKGFPRWVAQNEPQRGFVYQISCSPKEFLQHGAKIFDREPIFEVIWRGGPRKDVIRLASSDLLEQVRSITGYGIASLNGEEIQILFQSPHLKNLWSLSGIHPHYFIPRITQDPQFASLRRLELEHQQLGMENMKALSESSTLTELVSLRLTGDACDESARLLSRSPSMKKLKELHFRGMKVYYITSEGFRELIQSAWGANLEKLSLMSNRIGDEGLKNLPKTFRWPNLKVLDLADNQITDEGLQSLSRFLPKGIRELTLSANPIRGEGIASLLDSAAGESLEQLSIWGCEIQDEGLAAMAATGSTPPLKILQLNWHNTATKGVKKFSTKGLKVLLHSRQVENLRIFDLSNNPIGDRGAIAIAESPYLTNLLALNVTGCQIREKGLIALAQSSNLANLRRLELSWNPFSTEGIRALAQSEYVRNLSSLLIISANLSDDSAFALVESPYLKSSIDLLLSYNAFSSKAIKALKERFKNVGVD